MEILVDNLRWVDGFENIIIVPGNEQGQSEKAILNKGHKLLEKRYNILFDLHAYEKWLLNSTSLSLRQRIQSIKNKGFAIIMGEVGVKNVSDIMPIEHFLDAALHERINTLAWLWNTNSNDENALLTNEGAPNAHSNNNYWGEVYKNFLAH